KSDEIQRLRYRRYRSYRTVFRTDGSKSGRWWTPGSGFPAEFSALLWLPPPDANHRSSSGPAWYDRCAHQPSLPDHSEYCIQHSSGEWRVLSAPHEHDATVAGYWPRTGFHLL